MKQKQLFITICILCFVVSIKAQDYNPYKRIGKKAKVLTLSHGRYVEFFDTDSIQRIGTVMFNIRTKKVVRLLKAEQVYKKASDNSSASRWYSPDPLAEKYYSQSPYLFALNNPILFNDPDGRDVDPTNLKGKENITALQNLLSTKAGYKLIAQFMHKGGVINITIGGKTTTFNFAKEGSRAKDNLVLSSQPTSVMAPEGHGDGGMPIVGHTGEYERDNSKEYKELGKDKNYDITKGVTYVVSLDQGRNEEESGSALAHELSVHVQSNVERVKNIENKIVDGTLKPGTQAYVAQLKAIQNSAGTDHNKLYQNGNGNYLNISAQLDKLKNTNQYTELYKKDINGTY